ncbi:HD-GYP domain-containing protein [bacterium]|nr:MAG: HD-GYP domain-containing protein [bacterium]
MGKHGAKGVNMDTRRVEDSRAIIKYLDNSVRNTVLYPPTHQSVKAPVKLLLEVMNRMFVGREVIHIGVINGILYVENYLFYNPNLNSERILKVFNQFEIDDLAFRKGVDDADIISLSLILSLEEEGREVFLHQLARAAIKNIALKRVGSGFDRAGLFERELDQYRAAISTVQNLFSEVRTGAYPPIREAEVLVESFIDTLKTNRNLLMLFSSLKGYDAYTYQHCVNVGILALLLGESVGYDEKTLKWAALAGMMHDLGKAKLSSEVLNKPGGLTQREWEAVKGHPVHSAELVHAMGGGNEIVRAVEGHHKHLDGSGYPVHSLEKEPDPIARLLAVVDTYDAVTSIRPYKKPMNTEEALADIQRDKGTVLDPSHVDALIAMIGIYPPGAMVRLSSNEIGMVVGGGAQPAKPIVRMILDEYSRPYTEQWELDLSGREADGRIVAAVTDPSLHILGSSFSF